MRTSKRLAVLVVALMVLGACSTASDGVEASGSPALGARPLMLEEPATRTGLFGMNAQGASAAVFVPDGYDPASPAPLLVVLHGAHQQGRELVDSFRREADASGVILIAPNSDRASWDLIDSYGRNGADGMGFGADVGRIDALIGALFADYAVDPDRVAIAGFSDGASYALSLGLNNTELFNSIVAIAPGLLGSWPSEARARILIVHGERDRVLPVALSREGLVPQLRAAGLEVEWSPHAGGHELTHEIIAEAFGWLGWR